jgi:Tfp pilus assembly protein PilN
MLRTNLSTRPFYNQRAVAVAIGAVALVALGLSVYNAARVLSLTARSADLSGRVASAEARTQELSAQSRRIRESLNRADVSATETAAREANLLIDRRAFSWTSLFNRFEETLPGDVRITAVQPQVDRQGRFLLAINVISRSVEAVDTFIGEMEKSGAFRTALPVQEQLQEDNTFRSVIQAYYLPSATMPASTSEPGSTPGATGATGATGTTSAADAAPGNARRAR